MEASAQVSFKFYYPCALSCKLRFSKGVKLDSRTRQSMLELYYEKSDGYMVMTAVYICTNYLQIKVQNSSIFQKVPRTST